ncbi:MAG: hypothetical protein IJ977_01565, partial [Fibrobacter sp.]|nr:hypothetical protein [Fibrobacter sp.]
STLDGFILLAVAKKTILFVNYFERMFLCALPQKKSNPTRNRRFAYSDAIFLVASKLRAL